MTEHQRCLRRGLVDGVGIHETAQPRRRCELYQVASPAQCSSTWVKLRRRACVCLRRTFQSRLEHLCFLRYLLDPGKQLSLIKCSCEVKESTASESLSLGLHFPSLLERLLILLHHQTHTFAYQSRVGLAVSRCIGLSFGEVEPHNLRRRR